MTETPKLTVPELRSRKANGGKVVMVSVPDYPMAVWASRAGIDIVAVGDSLGMISYGHPNTLPVSMDTMIGHCHAVRRGAPDSFLLVSMPYGSYATPERAVVNALRFMKEADVDAVKMQGGKEKAPIIKAIADAGVPVMSHVGMCPHFMHHYGGFRLQGKTSEHALEIIEDARAIEDAGAVGFEIEAVPAPVAKAVDSSVSIFTFSIGAGAASCGQLLLGADLLGMFDQFKPKFTKRYAQLADVAVEALQRYAQEVRSGDFPDADHSYSMKAEQKEKLNEALEKTDRD